MRKEREKLLTRLESRGSLHIPIRVYVRSQLNLSPQAVFKRPAEYVATVIITVLHLQFCITVIITVLDYSLHLQFWITVYIYSFALQ